MFEVFEGTLGGGKTYSAVERMVKYLASGGVVVTNVTLKLDAVFDLIRERHGVECDPGQVRILTDDEVPEFHKHVPRGSMDKPTLVVLDELHLYFDARDSRTASRDIQQFLTQTRKWGIDVIMISQSMHNIDKYWVRLVGFIWRFKDMSGVRLPGLPMKWPWKQIVQAQYASDGRTRLGEPRWTTKDPAIFRCYETTQIFRTFPLLEARSVKLGKVPWYRRKSRMRLLIVVIIGGFILGGWKMYQLTKDGGYLARLAGRAERAQSAVLAPTNSVVVPPVAPEPYAVVFESGRAVYYTPGERRLSVPEGARLVSGR